MKKASPLQVTNAQTAVVWLKGLGKETDSGRSVCETSANLLADAQCIQLGL
jgi:hypothetical protein